MTRILFASLFIAALGGQALIGPASTASTSHPAFENAHVHPGKTLQLIRRIKDATCAGNVVS